jgi:riboflavin transporter FmnP
VVSLAEGLFARRSVALTGAAVFGSLAALTTIVLPANIQPAFPLLSFLRFDPAELFDVLAFLIFGPIPALITAIVHWAILAETGTNGILGPTGKFAAVLSTLLGLWLGSMTYRRIAQRNTRTSLALGTMLGFAALARVGLMVVVNYFIFTYIGPVIFGIDYLGFSQKSLAAVGMQFANSWQVLWAMLLFTSIFNGLHAAFSVIIPYMIFTPLSLKIPEIASGHPWISKFTSH